jgi:hypothetical protein
MGRGKFANQIVPKKMQNLKEKISDINNFSYSLNVCCFFSNGAMLLNEIRMNDGIIA